MLQAGASGYLLKQSAAAALIVAVRTVAAGQQYLDPGVRYTSDIAPAHVEPAAAAAPVEPLSELEARVLRLAATALSTAAIARQLGLDVVGVNAVRSEAMRKAGLASRLDIMRYARGREPNEEP